MVLEWYEGPLVEYTGEGTRSQLLCRVARMSDDPGTVDVRRGRSAASPSRARQEPRRLHEGPGRR